MFCAALLLSCVALTGSIAATLTDSTTLTVVNVTQTYYGTVPTGAQVGDWQHWPPADYMSLTTPKDNWEVLITDVGISWDHMSWKAMPSPYPWPWLVANLNAMIANVWSEDGGKTYKIVSWDYMTAYSTGIHLSTPWRSGIWLGTLVHSFCDFEGTSGDKCNGRYRSNVYFKETP